MKPSNFGGVGAIFFMPGVGRIGNCAHPVLTSIFEESFLDEGAGGHGIGFSGSAR